MITIFGRIDEKKQLVKNGCTYFVFTLIYQHAGEHYNALFIEPEPVGKRVADLTIKLAFLEPGARVKVTVSGDEEIGITCGYPDLTKRRTVLSILDPGFNLC
ncbi:MAG: hypothetical protein SFV17_12800 [Candidatus Obscuribacter sp.]|nr:hypothetical protein [Candidatus Obscuribacter sp.]